MHIQILGLELEILLVERHGLIDLAVLLGLAGIGEEAGDIAIDLPHMQGMKGDGADDEHAERDQQEANIDLKAHARSSGGARRCRHPWRTGSPAAPVASANGARIQPLYLIYFRSGFSGKTKKPEFWKTRAQGSQVDRDAIKRA